MAIKVAYGKTASLTKFQDAAFFKEAMATIRALPIVDHVPEDADSVLKVITEETVFRNRQGELISQGTRQVTAELSHLRPQDKKEPSPVQALIGLIQTGSEQVTTTTSQGAAAPPPPRLEKTTATTYATSVSQGGASAPPPPPDPPRKHEPQVVFAAKAPATSKDPNFPKKEASSNAYLEKLTVKLRNEGIDTKDFFVPASFSYPEGFWPAAREWQEPWKKFLIGIEKGDGEFVFDDDSCNKFLEKRFPAKGLPEHFRCAKTFVPKDHTWRKLVKEHIEKKDHKKTPKDSRTSGQCNRFLQKLKDEGKRHIPRTFNCPADFTPEDPFWTDKVNEHKSLKLAELLAEEEYDEVSKERVANTSFSLADVPVRVVAPPKQRPSRPPQTRGTRHTTQGDWNDHEAAVAAGSPVHPTPPQSRFPSPAK